ncbi:hypothetical protein TD95_002894 [Thielaviopsis punctulata]|uniref:Eukaryotic mitochondrial regulator protein-domain-containing protein n=1 Tax=Thielaviopsis punctulata TaxID=72032 RepID=A0A0F4ZD32_9PEZI|nr:hypothetical protein TD95_002894 [Thielaviopsis punctulata]
MSLRLGTTGLRTIVSAPAVPSARAFSTSPSAAGRLDPELRKRGLRTLGRQDMKRWLDTLENKWQERVRNGGDTSTGFYLGPHVDQPFPLNPQFRSQPVLSEAAREWIWRRVVQHGEALKVVSADLGVDVRRVAAVVRLKEVEKRWLSEGKPIATAYREGIMSMLPQTRYYIPRAGEPPAQHEPHEPINEIHTHGHTLQQIFWPVAESRSFTRADAATAFNQRMKTADTRSPHYELIAAERRVLKGDMTRPESMATWKQHATDNESQFRAEREARRENARQMITVVESDRFEFRFKDYNSEKVGKTGRGRNLVGHRYGVPNYDRKRGMVKIPTRVP